jgi:hypothetical protein
MTNTTLNYQLIYEEVITEQAKDTLELPRFYSDLEPNFRRLLEEFGDSASQQTADFFLDPEVLADTATLAAEMASQLYQFANMLSNQAGEPNPFVTDDD